MCDPKPAGNEAARPALGVAGSHDISEGGPASWGSALTPWGPELSLVEAAAGSLDAALRRRSTDAEASR